jgi:hypothetical protein
MIGVFDSGLGGLSVLAALVEALPQADFVYYADTAHVPYGNKSEAQIQRRVLAIGEHLANGAAACWWWPATPPLPRRYRPCAPPIPACPWSASNPASNRRRKKPGLAASRS